jgi:predicted phosphodiesterase
MIIAYASDLHNEWEPYDIPENTPSGDVLVLAGDILNVKLFELDANSGVAVEYDFFDKVTALFKNVIMVMGNHEYYGGDLSTSVTTLKKLLSKYTNVHILDGNTLVIDNVLFIGGTLWTNFNEENPATLSTANRLIADYSRIRDNGELISSSNILERHKHFVKWVTQVDKMGYDNVILVTHHSPSFQTTEDKYKDYWTMNGLFGSNLDSMLSMFDYAIFGHQHNPKTPVINGCTLLNNSRGYPFEETSIDFKFKRIII